MGDRAFIFFTNGETVSPVIDLLCKGSDVPLFLATAESVMACGPKDDVHVALRLDAPYFYAALLFQGCYGGVDGNVTIADWNIGERLEGAVRRTVQPCVESVPSAEAVLRNVATTFGLEAGIFVVNVRTAKWSWKAFGGSLQRRPKAGNGGWSEVHPG